MEDKRQDIIKEGDYVHYWPGYGKPENGRVKHITPHAMFIVFKCNDEWQHYKDYTGQNTPVEYVRHGWVDGEGREIPVWPENS
jgi:hypothetical protein